MVLNYLCFWDCRCSTSKPRRRISAAPFYKRTGCCLGLSRFVVGSTFVWPLKTSNYNRSVGAEHLFLVKVYKDGYCRSQVCSQKFVLVFCMGLKAQADVVFFSSSFPLRHKLVLLCKGRYSSAMGLVFS